MKEKTFTSGRFYNLRHDAEGDGHEEYEYANAVVYGEIESLEKKDGNVLEVIAKNPRGTDDEESYDVSINYDGSGKYVYFTNPEHPEYLCCWFDKVPEGYNKGATFDSCVFERTVSLKGYKSVIFHNCFFLNPVSVEDSPDCDMISFEQCAFKGNVTISKCHPDRLFIRNCNVLENLVIDDCIVGKWTSIHDVQIKQVSLVWDSVFSGQEFMFRRIAIGNGLEFSGCVFESPAEISFCSLEELRVRGCSFNKLTVCGIYTHRHLECEELVRISLGETSCTGDCGTCDDTICDSSPRER